jgi:hypothetical protein
VFGVLPEFGVRMPCGEVKTKIEDDLVVWFRKQSLKDRNPTLLTSSATLSAATLGESLPE